MRLTTALAALALAATGVAAQDKPAASPSPSPSPAAGPAAHTPATVSHAIAMLQPARDGKVEGTIHFHKRPAGMHVQGRITGLAPGAHGFHVHEYGDCSAPDLTSAGAHFNPLGRPHGPRTDRRRHVGDLGNVEAGADGSVSLDYTDDQLRFDGMRGILGRGVVVHAKADDLKSQPSGDAGGRLACGVIGVAKTE